MTITIRIRRSSRRSRKSGDVPNLFMKRVKETLGRSFVIIASPLITPLSISSLIVKLLLFYYNFNFKKKYYQR